MSNSIKIDIELINYDKAEEQLKRITQQLKEIKAYSKSDALFKTACDFGISVDSFCKSTKKYSNRVD